MTDEGAPQEKTGLFGFSRANLRLLVLGVGAAIFLTLVVWVFLSRGGEDYATLFTRLEPGDAAEIIQELEAANVSYRLEQNGSAILVPRDRVDKVRLSLAASGLPKGGSVGFELMDDIRIGASEFERQVGYLRGLQGELERTITQIKGVNRARVHISRPEDSLFVRDREKASAAVLLDLSPGVDLQAEQVKAVVNLVAGSVQQLEPEDVTVIDSRGRVLSARGPEVGYAMRPSDNLETQAAFETRLQSSVQSLLEQVLGTGNVAARVNARLSFDERLVERNLFEPVADGEGLTRSIQELREVFNGATGAGGPVGTAANLPGNLGGSYESLAAAGGASSYEKTETVRNIEVNQVHENIRIAPGTVERLSVAVVVNKNLSAEEADGISSLVSAAIGLDSARQDEITVLGMPFDTTLAEEVKKQLDGSPTTAEPPNVPQQWIFIGGGALALLLMAGMAALVISGRRRRKQMQEELLLRKAQAEARTEGESEKPRMFPENGNRVKRDLEHLARQHPDRVAQVLRAWLAEDY